MVTTDMKRLLNWYSFRWGASGASLVFLFWLDLITVHRRAKKTPRSNCVPITMFLTSEKPWL